MINPPGNGSQGSRSAASTKLPTKKMTSCHKLPLQQPESGSPLPRPIENGIHSPSLVQFSYQQERRRFNINLFSVLRFALIAANTAGLAVCIIQTHSADLFSLQTTVLRLFFLLFSLILSGLDLVHFHYRKLPHRVEAMLDLLLATSFLIFFIIGVLVDAVATDIVYFVISVLHLLSYFNTLIRAHRISVQLKRLSHLSLRDIERGQLLDHKAAASPTTCTSSPIKGASTPVSPVSPSSNRKERPRTITETITAIRSPCIELEGSSRWTIVSENLQRT